MDMLPDGATELVCPRADCVVDTLLVRRWPALPDSWSVARAEGDAPWIESAAEPFCPLCGTTLVPAGGAASAPKLTPTVHMRAYKRRRTPLRISRITRVYRDDDAEGAPNGGRSAAG